MGEDDFRSRIEAAGDDAAALGEIANELRELPEPWAGPLRMQAIGRKLKVSAPPRKPLSPLLERPPQPVPNWLSAFSSIPPDGRPLYRYRLTSDAYSRLQKHLTNRAPVLQFHTIPSDAALFVLWAAEWFRRCYDGRGQEWRRLGAPIGVRRDQAGWRKLADEGLKRWGIPPLRINGAHHRLAALARQGGFPIAALEGQGAGWAPRYLERLVGLLLNESDLTLENAGQLAASLSGLVPDTWRNEEMQVVCAELALEVVRLRRLAEAAGVPDGSLISTWLDSNCEGWREDLPLSVDSNAGKALVDGLMKAIPLRGGAGSVQVERRLLLNAGQRSEQILLRLDGSLKDSDGRALSKSLATEWSRLRVYPSAAFAHHVAGELAVADPDEQGVWVARSVRAQSAFPMPFEVAVTTELRGDGQPVGQPFVLPGGSRLSSGLRVCLCISPEGVTPTEFKVIGSGSGGYRAESVFLDIPEAWCVDAPEAEEVEGGRASGRAIWKVTGAATVTTDRSDRYLVRTGQQGEQRDALCLIGNAPSRCVSSDAAGRLFSGTPRVELQEGRRSRAPGAQEAWWRPRGERSWRPYVGEVGPGACEIAWRDIQTGHIRDRHDAVILPKAFKIERRLVGDWIDLSVEGWAGAVEFEGGRSGESGSWRFPAKGTSRSRCEVRLSSPGLSEICLAVPVPHQALIEHWTEGPCRPNSSISLSTINQFVARVEGRCELMADLLDHEGKAVDQGVTSWWIDGEMPLSTIRDDLASLLRPLGDLRARVKLNFNDSHNNYWFVGEFDHELRKDGRGLIPSKAVVEEGVRVSGRSLQNPVTETDFGPYGLHECVNHRPIELPTLHGNWLVYLRSNERVLSCPHFIRGKDLAVPPSSELGRAMAHLDRFERDGALNELCDELISDPTSKCNRDTIRLIIDLSLKLNGLPPSTFDILALICRRPRLGILMLFQALRTEVEPILRLTEGLPFAWPLVPKAEWDAAANAYAEFLFRSVPDEFALVAKAVGDRRKELAEADPALRLLLDLPVPPRDSIRLLSNAFLTRSVDRIQVLPNPFRPSLASELPEWNVGEGYWRALDAPFAAARAAQAKVQLNRAQIYCVKDISRRHPRWFTEAFTAALQET